LKGVIFDSYGKVLNTADSNLLISQLTNKRHANLMLNLKAIIDEKGPPIAVEKTSPKDWKVV